MRRSVLKKAGLLAFVAVFSAACAFTSLAAKERLSTPDDLYWSSTSKEDDSDYDEGSYAKWEEVEHATKYEVTLYREDDSGSKTKVGNTVSTKNTRYNFRSRMDKEGDYYFRVKAESSKSDYSDSYWSSYSDPYYVSASAAENVANGAYSDSENPVVGIIRDHGWETDEIGSKYKQSDGTYAPEGWLQDTDDLNWYYIGPDGYMMTGFINSDDKVYYCDPAGTPAGAMVTGTVTLDGVTYNFDESGALVSSGDAAVPAEDAG